MIFAIIFFQFPINLFFISIQTRKWELNKQINNQKETKNPQLRQQIEQKLKYVFGISKITITK